MPGGRTVASDRRRPSGGVLALAGTRRRAARRRAKKRGPPGKGDPARFMIRDDRERRQGLALFGALIERNRRQSGSTSRTSLAGRWAAQRRERTAVRATSSD